MITERERSRARASAMRGKRVEALGKMVAGQKTLKCVRNACSAMQGLSTAFAPLVIGMVDVIDDEAALVFARANFARLESEGFTALCQ